MSPAAVLAAYRLLYCALLAAASFQTLAHEQGHAAVLAAAELGGAALLCVRRTQWAGLALLLAVFALAQLHAALANEWPLRFLQFAASAALVVLMDRLLSRATAAPASAARH